jgi:hypothetical protein
MAATRAAAINAALRSKWPRPIGVAGQAPKHVHGGRSPCRSFRAISAVNATSTTAAMTAKRPTLDVYDSPAASLDPPETTNDAPTLTAAMTLIVGPGDDLTGQPPRTTAKPSEAAKTCTPCEAPAIFAAATSSSSWSS